MYTPLFYGVETPNTFIAPILEPLDVARQVVKAIENRQGGEIYAPWYVGYMYFSLVYGADYRWMMRGLPSSLSWFVRWLGGVDRAMTNWLGSQKFAENQSLELNGKAS